MQNHVKGSKTKYQAGTIVTTATGRRAEVQADGRWKWLAKQPSAVAPASQAPKRPSKPRPKRSEYIELSGEKKERKVPLRETEKQPLPKKTPVLKRQNAKLKLATPPPPEESDAFTSASRDDSPSFKKKKRRRKAEASTPKTGWLSWL